MNQDSDDALSQIRNTLKNHLQPLTRELNISFDPELPIEQQTAHVLRRLADDRSKTLKALAAALQTLALILEMEEQLAVEWQPWTHRDRKAIATLIKQICSSRLDTLSWVDASVARLNNLNKQAGDF